MGIQWNKPDIEEVRTSWIATFGGSYPDAMIDAYLGFVESIAGTAAFSMTLLQKAHTEIETAGKLTGGTRAEINQLITRDFDALQHKIRQSFQALFQEPHHD
jgi:hypothetical protein